MGAVKAEVQAKVGAVEAKVDALAELLQSLVERLPPPSNRRVNAKGKAEASDAKQHHVSVPSDNSYACFVIPKSSPKTGASWQDSDLKKFGIPMYKKKGSKREYKVRREYFFRRGNTSGSFEAAAIEFSKKMIAWLENPKRVKSKVPTWVPTR